MLAMFANTNDPLADELFGRPTPPLERKKAAEVRVHRTAKAAVGAGLRFSSNNVERNSPERATPSVGQYLYHLNHDLRNFTRAETLNAVIGANPVEIQRVAKLAAKLKGRYLALIIDLGTAERGTIGETDMRELERARRMSEEAEAGLAALRAAIESGDLELDGVKAAE